MIQFKSVRITHNILQRIEFTCLAEFFRFIGVFMCEEILTDPPEERTEAERNTKYSAQIYVGKRKLSEEEAGKLNLTAEQYEKKVASLPEKTIFLCDIEERQNSAMKLLEKGNLQEKILQDLMAELLNAVFVSPDDAGFDVEQINDLINIYVEHKIWLHSMNMQYYSRRKSEIASNAEKCFLAAEKAVQKALDKKPGVFNARYLYEYARLWCQVKTNSACDYNREVLYFVADRLSERCGNLYKKYPDFTNALILQGLSYETSSSRANEAVTVFWKALEDIDEECFASPVYYWIGKRYEGFQDKKSVAEQNYRLANQHKVKFRNLFKLAIASKDRGDADTALEQFSVITKKLALKQNNKLLDPLELEYLFKVYYQQSYICYKEEDYAKAIEYGRECEKIWDKRIKESQYFEAFYGDGSEGAEFYRKELRKRLNIKVVYHVLVDCYARVFQKEQADAYCKKLEAVSE